MPTSCLADDFDGFIVDLDGVVHIAWEPLDGAAAALAELAHRGKGIVYLTNEPRYSRDTVARRLTEMGIAAGPGSVVTAGWVAAGAVGRGTVFVIGSDELRREVAGRGATVVDADHEGEVDVVLVAGHTAFDYAELRAACRAGARGARLVATGRDATFPMPDGPWPATGAILAAVETAVGRASHVVGKPEPDMFDLARRRLGPGKVAVVGDRVETDILGGRRAGLPTILVQAAASAALETSEAAPDHVVPSLAALLWPR